jgi:HK97 family phage major capsid protein
MKHAKLNLRARGIMGVRADANTLPGVLAELNKTFEEFKAERTKELDDLKKGLGDYVQTEKVDRINAEISELTKVVNEAKATIDALRIGGGGDAPDPAKAAHAAAFDRFFRKGVEADLSDLQVKAALTTDSDPDGGYIVPTQTETTIDRVLETVSAMRALSRVVSISAGEYAKIVNLGGAASGWVGEKQARPETDGPTLAKIVINSGEIYANPAATQQMLDDAAVDIAAWLAEEVAIEFAEQEGAAFINGDGVNKPRGILQYDKVANASYAWGKTGFVVTGAAATFLTPTTTASPADALVDLYYSLKSGYRAGASFVTSDPVMGTIRKFKDGDGTFLWQPPTTDGPATLLGKPIETDDNMPALGANAFPVAFGNFQRGYLITDRIGIRVLRDPYTNKPYVQFYTTKRVGGGIVNFEAIKLLKCST